MVGFDLPNVAHDMILRFMGVNFSAIADGSARIPSSIGDESKPVFVGSEDAASSGDGSSTVPSGKTPEQDKAMWEGMSLLPVAFSLSGLCVYVMVKVWELIVESDGLVLWFCDSSVLQRRFSRHRPRYHLRHHRRILLVSHSPSFSPFKHGCRPPTVH